MLYRIVNKREDQDAVNSPSRSAATKPSASEGTLDTYVDACFNMEFEESQEERRWSDVPEAAAVAEAANDRRTEEALRLAQALRDKHPDFHLGYYWVGELQRRQQRYSDARECLLRGLDLTKSKYALCEMMGQVHCEAGNLAAAVKWWIRSCVIQLRLEDIEAHTPFLNLSYVAEGMGLSSECAALRQTVDGSRQGRDCRLSADDANRLYRLTHRLSERMPVALAIQQLCSKLTPDTSGAVMLPEKMDTGDESTIPEPKGKRTDASSSQSGNWQTALAQALAPAWWNSDDAAAWRERGAALCDSCGNPIPAGGGCLCNPLGGGSRKVSSDGLYSADLVCDSCFERKSYKAWCPDPKPKDRSVQTRELLVGMKQLLDNVEHANEKGALNVIKLLKHEYPEVTDGTTYALGAFAVLRRMVALRPELFAGRALRELRALADDPDERIRAVARELVDKITDRMSREPGP